MFIRRVVGHGHSLRVMGLVLESILIGDRALLKPAAEVFTGYLLYSFT